MGQHKKNIPPIMNQNIFMEKVVLANTETMRAEPRKYKVATVFCGDLQWYILEEMSAKE